CTTLFRARVGGKCLQGGHGVGRTVEGGDTDGDTRFEGADLAAVGHDLRPRCEGCVPTGLHDLRVGFSGEVEPDPAAVLERRQRDLEFHGVVLDHRAVDADAGAVDLGAVEVHAGLAGDLQFQDHGIQL